jgi:hypothetical protein
VHVHIVRIIIAVPLLALFLGGAIGNARIVWRSRRYPGERQPSMIPLVCGIVGVVGLRVLPYESIHPYAWLPLLLDPGSALLTIRSLPSPFREMYTESAPRIAIYSYHGPQTLVELALYRSGAYRLWKTHAMASVHQAGTWGLVGDRLLLRAADQEIVYLLTLDQQQRGRKMHRLVWSPDSTATAFDGLELRLTKGKPLTSR